MSLVEVMVAVTVILIGFLALAQAIITGNALRRSADERRAVHNAFHRVAEEVRLIATEARAEPETWPRTVLAALSPTGRLGDAFDVPGLAAVAGEPRVGRIEVVTDETSTDEELRVLIGMPRDLDADGRVVATDVRGTATMLPVLVTLRWSTVRGTRVVRRGFYVTAF